MEKIKTDTGLMIIAWNTAFVNGESSAAFGDFSVCKNMPLNPSIKEQLAKWSDLLSPTGRPGGSLSPVHCWLPSRRQRLPPCQKFQKTNRAKLENFLPCRDQLKIMCIFSGLDLQRLAEDELIRLHGTHLLHQNGRVLSDHLTRLAAR